MFHAMPPNNGSNELFMSLHDIVGPRGWKGLSRAVMCDVCTNSALH
jgi:hypothetical protein